MSKHIAILEDETDIAELVALHLRRAGFSVDAFSDAESYIFSLKDRVPDMLILDLMLPDMDGFDVCRYLRRHEEYAAMPIIMLTARTEETDRVVGLELGADDYVTKPFSTNELVARVRAVLRRQQLQMVEKRQNIGDSLVIDLARHEVLVSGEKVTVTPTEFRILQLLASKSGWVFSRDQILEHLWGQDKIVVDRTVDVHIRNLRRKLGPAARFIKNIRGTGYKLEP